MEERWGSVKLEYQVMEGTEVSVRRTRWGGPRPQILGGGRKRWGKVDRAALCSCRADEEGEGRQPAAPTMCRRRLSVKNQMRENGRADVGTWQPAPRAERQQRSASPPPPLPPSCGCHEEGFSFFFWAVKFLAVDRRTDEQPSARTNDVTFTFWSKQSHSLSPAVAARSKPVNFLVVNSHAT